MLRHGLSAATHCQRARQPPAPDGIACGCPAAPCCWPDPPSRSRLRQAPRGCAFGEHQRRRDDRRSVPLRRAGTSALPAALLLLFDHFLSPEGLSECRGQVARMLRQVHPDLAPEWIVAAHRIEPWIFQLASAPKLLDMIERQIGPNITFWSSHLLCKPPHTGRDVPWHQDAKEWNLSGDFGASIRIPLDDLDAASGTMPILPGWHRKGAGIGIGEPSTVARSGASCSRRAVEHGRCSPAPCNRRSKRWGRAVLNRRCHRPEDRHGFRCAQRSAAQRGVGSPAPPS